MARGRAGDHKGPPIGIKLSDLTMSSFAALRIWFDGAARSFAALRMTGLHLAGGEELSRAFEPCLKILAWICDGARGADNEV